MRQVEYRGYARGQGFNPVQVPDSTRKIAERDQAYISGMQRYASQLQANRQNYQQGMERKFAAEEQNRRENFQWQEKEAQRYQNAVLRNIETERQNAATAAQFVGQDKTVLQALSGLSQSISKGLIEYDKKVSAEQEAEGKSLVVENGLNPALIARYQAQKAALSESDKRINNVANQLDFEGVPVSVIEQYLSLSGWRKVGATASLVQQGADNYPMYALQMRSSGQTLDIGNGEFDIGKPRTPEEYKAVEAFLRTEYLKNFNGISDTVLNEYLYPGMRKFEANERAQYFSEYEKNVASRIQGERVSDLITNSRAGGGEGFLDWVNRTSGGDRNLIGETRRQGFESLAQAIKTGQMSPGEWQAIKDFEFVPRGQSKPVTIGEYYGGEVTVVDNAVAQKEREDYEQRQQDKAIANEELDELARQVLFGPGGADSAMIKDIEEKYLSLGLRVPEFVKAYQTPDQQNREDKKLQLLAYANRNALDSRTLFRIAKGDEELIREFKADAQRGDQLQGLNKGQVDGAMGILQGRMYELLEQTGNTERSSSAALFGIQMAENEFNAKALELLQNGRSETEAINGALQHTLTLMWNGMGTDFEKRTGPFRISRDRWRTLSPFDAMGAGNSFDDTNRRLAALRPGAWRDEVILKPNELAAVERFRDGKGGIPPIITRLAKTTGRSPIDLMEAQLNLAGKELFVPVLSETVRRGMTPEMRRLLEYRPSAGNTYQAFGMNPGDGTQPWKPLLDLIASKESTAYGGYEAMNTGGSNGGRTAYGSADSRNVFPGGITKRTVGEILELQRQGKIHAAGRYQIINDPSAPTLSRLMQGKYGPTGVKMTDLFDAATQDKLAIALIRGRAGKFFSGTGSLGDAVTGMGNEWIGLQKLPRERIARALETTRQVLNSPNPFRQPEGMRANVVYKIDSLGYGSTGPHLDVKPVRPGSMQSDRNLPAYQRGQLDQFVEITLPNGKRGALSQLSVTTDDDRKHRARGSFGHDYAAPKGSTLRLKNGARAVGSFKGDQGTDHLIIELPDGRRFQFLHGTIG